MDCSGIENRANSLQKFSRLKKHASRSLLIVMKILKNVFKSKLGEGNKESK
jgi:hypothetical protein